MQQIIDQLKQFGLGEDEARVYLYILQNGFQTALNISRSLHIGRTKVYRILDDLKDLGLVNHKLTSRGLEFGSLSYRQLEFLLIEREKELQTLKQKTPILFEQLEKLVPLGNDPSQVLYYSGCEGLEQVTYNSTKAQEVLRIYEVDESMDAFVDHKTSETMRRLFVQNNIHIRQLTNKKHIKGHTDVKEIIKLWEVRHLPEKQLKISFEVMIYNDVYVIYSFHNKDIFCVEIYNQQLAQMQKELFDFVWVHSKKMVKVGERGEARVQ